MSHIKRRRFLQSVLAIGAGSLLFPYSAQSGFSQPHVLVIGNGVGGQMFTRALSRLAPAARITLVDPGRASASPGRVTYLSDIVTGLDFNRKIVQTTTGASIGYDVLVLSPGADIRWGVIEGYTPSVVEAMPHGWMGKDHGAGLHARLDSLPQGATVMLYVPRGVIRFPAGVNQRIDAVSRYLAQNNPGAKLVILDARQTMHDGAIGEKRKEWVHLSADEDVVAVEPRTNTLYSASNSFRGDLVNLIPPQQAGGIARRYGLADAAGWCPVDGSTGRSLAEPGVYVLGDASAADNATKNALTASRQAFQCAEHLARTCW